MAIPKDYVVYIDENNNTQAALQDYETVEPDLKKRKLKIIGFVSSGSKADAIAYCDQMFR
jgi:hypothetical protein